MESSDDDEDSIRSNEASLRCLVSPCKPRRSPPPAAQSSALHLRASDRHKDPRKKELKQYMTSILIVLIKSLQPSSVTPLLGRQLRLPKSSSLPSELSG